MLQIVGEDEIAERRPYKFSEKVAEKIRKRRKEKELKRKNMAHVIVRIDTLDEIIPEDIICGNRLRKSSVQCSESLEYRKNI